LIFYGLKIDILPLSAPLSILIWFINKSFPCPFILSVGRNKSNNLVFFKVTDVVNQPEGQIRSSSIEIPLLIQYAFGNKIQPSISAGLTMGYNLKSKIEFDLTGLNFTGNMKDVTATFDLGITFGGGVQVPVGFGTIFLEGRYAYGLANQRTTGTTTVISDVYQFDLQSDKEEDKYTNRGFQLLAGILITL